MPKTDMSKRIARHERILRKIEERAATATDNLVAASLKEAAAKHQRVIGLMKAFARQVQVRPRRGG